MTTNPIALLVKKEMALDIIELMRKGKSMKEACEERGIEERAFHNTIAKFPEIAEAMDENHRARIAAMWDTVTKDTVENAQVLSDYQETLRLRIKESLMADGAAKMLMAIDKHNQRTIEILRPIIPTSGNPPPPTQNPDAARANQILAQMRGAKRVHAELQVETYRVTIGGGDQEENPDVLNVEATDLPGETTPESQSEDSNSSTLPQLPDSPQTPQE